MKLAQSEGTDDIMSLKEQIMQLCVVIWSPPQQTVSGNPQPLGNERNGNRNQNNTMGDGNSQNSHKNANRVG